MASKKFAFLHIGSIGAGLRTTHLQLVVQNLLRPHEGGASIIEQLWRIAHGICVLGATIMAAVVQVAKALERFDLKAIAIIGGQGKEMQVHHLVSIVARH